jgi:hypothetical protein
MPPIDPWIPCNFSRGKLSFYVPSDFSLAVLQRYGPQTHTLVFGTIPPNARFRVTRQVLATLVEYSYLLPSLECIFSWSGNVAGDVADEDILPVVRSFRGLKSIYLEGYPLLTDKTFIGTLSACPELTEIIISAGAGNVGKLTQSSLGAFFMQPRLGLHVTRVELLHQSPSAFTEQIILPLIYDFATRRGAQTHFRFWKSVPMGWEEWMLPEPGEVARDVVQGKVGFGPEWFRRRSTREQLRVFESWQGGQQKKAEEKSVKNSGWKGSIRKKMGFI